MNAVAERIDILPLIVAVVGALIAGVILFDRADTLAGRLARLSILAALVGLFGVVGAISCVADRLETSSFGPRDCTSSEGNIYAVVGLGSLAAAVLLAVTGAVMFIVARPGFRKQVAHGET